MRQTALRTISVGTVVVMFFLAPGASPQPGPPIHAASTITVQPVSGVTIGPGKKLWVHVFPAQGKGKPGTGTVCTDDGEQSAGAALGPLLPVEGLAFNINPANAPIPPAQAEDAIRTSFETWEIATQKALFQVSSSGGASGPAADGNNTVGWIVIVPKNVLAATWVWTETGTDGKDYVSDVDVFYNLSQPWGVFETCSSTETRFDVGNVGTHEIGHVIGLAHVSDVERQATMYPSAPKGEVKKKTLTGGDISEASALTLHMPPRVP
jgi:hypothetical protein